MKFIQNLFSKKEINSSEKKIDIVLNNEIDEIVRKHLITFTFKKYKPTLDALARYDHETKDMTSTSAAK